MLPPGVEARPDLQVTGGVLAFGFSEEAAVGDRAAALLSEELLDHVLQAAAQSPPDFVVVDMRNVRNLSSAGLGHVLALRRRLQPAPWKMVLMLGDPVLRGVVSATGLDRSLSISVVGSEAELRGLLDG